MYTYITIPSYMNNIYMNNIKFVSPNAVWACLCFQTKIVIFFPRLFWFHII